jgi:hypothetical protein
MSNALGQASTAAMGGYYVPHIVYNGMVVRARSFDLHGVGGRTVTNTYLVNRPAGAGYGAMDWNNTRIISIAVTPEDFVDPIRGFHRNWDRGFNSYSARVPNWDDLSETEQRAHVPNASSHWINRFHYNWEAQIRAGLWDGRDWNGNVVPGANGGRGLTVLRQGANNTGRAVSAEDQDGPRPLVNVEMYCGNCGYCVDGPCGMIVNQLARAWVFGNWSRMFPIRSIRINFNQGDGDVRTPDLIPGTRRHYLASDEVVSRFRHINLRAADPDATNLRDPLVQQLAHPLRPIIQNPTYAAVFINGEFWGMQNVQTHRHAALINEIFDMDDRNVVQLEGPDTFIDLARLHIFFPSRGSSGTESTIRRVPDPITGNRVDAPVRGVNTDNTFSVGGARRTALGAGSGTGTTAANHAGYARPVPAVYPDGHPQAGQPVPGAGSSHLTRAWYDYLDTIYDMDEFIDYMILGIYFENWDWMSNNMEMWRVTELRPGQYGGDGRWRFVVQDFDNAIFHGASNYMNFFTGMTSPACLAQSCEACPGGEIQRPAGNACRGEVFDPQAALPVDWFANNRTNRRSEDAARVLRVLFQNPYFRNAFAARLSTYSGTAFHPNRVTAITDYYVDRRAIRGRDHLRWGLMNDSEYLQPNTFGPVMTPWAGTGEQRGLPVADRADNWLGVTRQNSDANAVGPIRWLPQTLRGESRGYNAIPDAKPGNPLMPGDPGTADGGPTNMILRSQENVLLLRASHAAGGLGIDNQNAIEHMREYFSRGAATAAGVPTGVAAFNNTHSLTMAGTGYSGRENLVGGGSLITSPLGRVSHNVQINWRVAHAGNPTGATNGDVGWLDINGAQIRADLFGWGGHHMLNTALPTGFTRFRIGEFSARYLSNMPIEVTANPLPGQRFSHFIVTGDATVWAGGRLSTNGMSVVDGTQRTIGATNQINDRTIRVIPTGGALGTAVTNNVTVTAHFTAAPNTAIIHQIYGNGGAGENAISHGFIELYNPHTTAVDLAGRSLQVQIANRPTSEEANPPIANWNVLTFPSGTSIPAQSSFLVVSGCGSLLCANCLSARAHVNTNTNPAAGYAPRYVIPPANRDLVWCGALPHAANSISFSNRNMSVALVNGTAALSPIITSQQMQTVDDLVGTRNEITDILHNVWGPSHARRISRSSTARRIHIAPPVSSNRRSVPRNTHSNYLDFREVRYGAANRGEIEYFRPRALTDGAWASQWIGSPRQVVVVGGDGARVFPASAHQGRYVGFNTGTVPVGMVFDGWSADSGITVQNANSMDDAYFIMPAGSGTVTVTANFVPLSLANSSVIINQVHGQGGPSRDENRIPTSENALSHGFIELYNPTGNYANLSAMSVQVRNDNSGPWHVLPLVEELMEAGSSAMLAPGSSFLIVSTDWFKTTMYNGHRPRYIFQQWDMGWDLRFSNNSLNVAIVDGTAPLSPILTVDDWSRVVDLVGAVNDGEAVANFLGVNNARRISRQSSVRRSGAYQNTRNNRSDFETIDYRYPIFYPAVAGETAGAQPNVARSDNGITNEELERFRPRHSRETRPAGSVTVVGGGIIGSGTSHNPATQGTTVTISAGWSDGQIFSHWTVREGGVFPTNREAGTTTFTMGNQPVVLVANWASTTVVDTLGPYDIVFTAPPEPPSVIFDMQTCDDFLGIGRGTATALPNTTTGTRNWHPWIFWQVGGDNTQPNPVHSGSAPNREFNPGIGLTGTSQFPRFVLNAIPFQPGNNYRFDFGGTITGLSGTAQWRKEPQNNSPNTFGMSAITGGNFSVTATRSFAEIQADMNAGVAQYGINLPFNATTIIRINTLRITRIPGGSPPPPFGGAVADIEFAMAGAVFADAAQYTAAVQNLDFGAESTTYQLSFLPVPGVDPAPPIASGGMHHSLPSARLIAGNAPLPAGYTYSWRLVSGSPLGNNAVSLTPMPGGATQISSTSAGTARVRVDIIHGSTGVPTTHSVTVNRNIGSGAAAIPSNPVEAGASVFLNAGDIPEGHIFSGWTSTTSGVSFRNQGCPTTASFVMPAGNAAVTANFTAVSDPRTLMPASGIIINQIHGNGPVGENAVSHGFIELYNPTNTPLSLSGLSLQLQNPGDPAIIVPPTWQMITLPPVTMQPRTSYLVVSTAWFNTANPHHPELPNHTPNLIINDFDLEWPIEFGNRTMTVALVQGTGEANRLSPIISATQWGRVLDLVASENGNSDDERDRADNFLVAPRRPGATRSQSIRRIQTGTTFVNNRNNSTDFMPIHFGNATPGELFIYRPRHRGEPAWPQPNVSVTIMGTAAGQTALDLYSAPPGTPISVTVSAPAGQRFTNAANTPIVVSAVGSPAVTFQLNVATSRLTATGTFNMPDTNRTFNVNATFEDRPQGLIINQVYGQGMLAADSTNAVSHGFIELYNPTSAAIPLGGMSVQIQSPADTIHNTIPPPLNIPWQRLNLNAVSLEPNHSYLIVSNSWVNTGSNPTIIPSHTPRHVITAWDQTWNVDFSNRTLAVALVANTTDLSPTLTATNWGNIIDIVGANNNNINARDRIDNFSVAPAINTISRQSAARRIDLANTGVNADDFRSVNYRDMSPNQLARWRPRRRGDGPWSATPQEVTMVLPSTAQVFTSPSIPQAPGVEIRFTLIPPAGQMFQAAGNASIAINLVGSPSVNFNVQVAANRLSAAGTFIMPMNGGTITIPANLFVNNTLFTQNGLIVNQIYGRSFDSDSDAAISRGFIELYNPTAAAVDVSNGALQIQIISDGPPEGSANHSVGAWTVFPFNTLIPVAGNRSIPAGGRLLIVTQQNDPTARFVMDNWDATINSPLSNRNFSVAVTANTTALASTVNTVGINTRDIVGVWNNNDGERDQVVSFLGTFPANRISNQVAARRVWNDANTAPLNARNNIADFRGIRYGAGDDGLTFAQIDRMRPRTRAGLPGFPLPPMAVFNAGSPAAGTIEARIGANQIASGTTIASGSTVTFTASAPNNSTQLVPIWTVDGTVRAGNTTNTITVPNVTIPVDVSVTWLRVGAVTTDGLGHVTSFDLTHLARHVISLQNPPITHHIADNRIGNLAGYDRVPSLADVTLMARWLIGYDIATLRSQTPLTSPPPAPEATPAG